MLSLLLLACTQTITGVEPPCVPEAPVPEADGVEAGATLRLFVHPILTEYDTRVLLGGLDAEVLGVDRDGCDAFDTCVSDEGCSSCGDCDACGPALLTCVESVRVRVPEVAPGEHAVTVWSQYGETLPGRVTVIGADTAAVR